MYLFVLIHIEFEMSTSIFRTHFASLQTFVAEVIFLRRYRLECTLGLNYLVYVQQRYSPSELFQLKNGTFMYKYMNMFLVIHSFTVSGYKNKAIDRLIREAVQKVTISQQVWRYKQQCFPHVKPVTTHAKQEVALVESHYTMPVFFKNQQYKF